MRKITLMVTALLLMVQCIPDASLKPPRRVALLGGVFGKVTDKSTGSPIPDVQIIVKGTDYQTQTDRKGNYQLTGLGTTNYTILYFHENCDTLVVDGLEMQIGEMVRIDVTLIRNTSNNVSYGYFDARMNTNDKKDTEKEEKRDEEKEGNRPRFEITILNDKGHVEELPPVPPEGVKSDKSGKTRPVGTDEFQKQTSPKAAAHNDNEEYPYYLSYLDRFQDLSDGYHFDFRDRYIIRITDGQDRPLWNIPFSILNQKDSLLWESATFANGENLFFPHIMSDYRKKDRYYFSTEIGGQVYRTPLITQFQHLTHIQIPLRFPKKDLALDLLFILDTTGSMGDEIQQLKDTIYSIYTRIQGTFPDVPLRFGLILYRDREDDYVVQRYLFTDNIEIFQWRVDQAEADGGGDNPEDMQAALQSALTDMNWHDEALKLTFLLADAPPHLDYGQNYTYLDAALDANQKNIKLFTVGASGLDPVGEYIFRQMSALTYGEFIFLTYGEKGESDGTGEGKVSHHTGDNYESHHLDDLVVSIVRKEMSYQLSNDQLARQDIDPRQQENYLRIRMDNMWIQIRKQLAEFMEEQPVGILAPFHTGDEKLTPLAKHLHELCTVSLIGSHKISLVERARLDEMFAERKLTLSGFIQSNQYDEIASLLGANILFLGELNYAGMDRVVYIRAVKTRDSQIVAAARIRL